MTSKTITTVTPKIDPIKCSLEEALDYLLIAQCTTHRSLLIRRFDVQDYFNSEIHIDEAVKIAQQVNHPLLWAIVIKRTDLLPKEAINIAKKVGGTKIWDLIEERGDTDRYLVHEN